ncbi:MAG: sugar ABC transporter substrate-binding protein [Nocardioidaceae bacterium]
MKFNRCTVLTCASLTAIALAAAGCSSSDGAASGGSASGDSGSALAGSANGALVQVIDAVPTPAVLGLDEGYKQQAAEFGIDMQVAQSSGDPTKDLANVQDAIAKGAKGLLLIPLSVDAIKPALKQAVDAGICVGVAYSNITEDNEITPGIKTYFGYDDTEGGKNLVAAMGEKMGGEGGIVFIGGTAADPGTQAREAGIKAELAASYPDITFLDSQPADYDPAKARSVMQDYVQKYGDKITGVITAADSMSQPVADYLATTDLAGKVLVGSFGGQQSFVDEIKAGKGFATVPLPVVDDGARAMQRIAECIEGDTDTVFDSSTTQTAMEPLADANYVVTADNVDSYQPQY